MHCKPSFIGITVLFIFTVHSWFWFYCLCIYLCSVMIQLRSCPDFSSKGIILLYQISGKLLLGITWNRSEPRFNVYILYFLKKKCLKPVPKPIELNRDTPMMMMIFFFKVWKAYIPVIPLLYDPLRRHNKHNDSPTTAFKVSSLIFLLVICKNAKGKYQIYLACIAKLNHFS